MINYTKKEQLDCFSKALHIFAREALDPAYAKSNKKLLIKVAEWSDTQRAYNVVGDDKQRLMNISLAFGNLKEVVEELF